MIIFKGHENIETIKINNWEELREVLNYSTEYKRYRDFRNEINKKLFKTDEEMKEAIEKIKNYKLVRYELAEDVFEEAHDYLRDLWYENDYDLDIREMVIDDNYSDEKIIDIVNERYRADETIFNLKYILDC